MRARRLRNMSSHKMPPKVLLSIGISVLLAVGIAGLVHVLDSPPGRATEPSYSIDPASITLTMGDVGPSFPLVNEGALGPSQHTPPQYPLPYQQQFISGWDRNFMVQSALIPPGRTEIETYEQARGFRPTNPPTIFGPFVAAHQGLFEVNDAELSYQTASAAHPDYLVAYPAGIEIATYKVNYGNWQLYQVQLGDEAYAWGGIRESPTGPPAVYEEQTYVIHWQHGPVVSTIFVRGAHDLTLNTALHFARIVDARIAGAIQQTVKGASYAFHPQDLATSTTVYLALCPLDHRTGYRPDCP